MLSWFIALLFVLFGVSDVYPLTCLQCSSVPRPRLCQTVSECAAGQICGTEKMRNDFGEEVYNVGCFSALECSAQGPVCMECCNTSLCNAEGCGQDGYPQGHDLICYSCDAFTDSVHCHSIDVCPTGEVCLFESKRLFGENVYSSKCAHTNLCPQRTILPVNIVGRELASVYNRAFHASSTCLSCCNEDLCNSRCNSTGIEPSQVEPTDCLHILRSDASVGSGVYTVVLWKSRRQVQVYCDMDTDGGGWTVFQSRFNGSVDFYRNFSDYEYGFGSPSGEFWLGLSYIQELAAKNQTELRLDLVAANGSTAYEVFKSFTLGIGPDYTLHISSGTGTAGDISGLSYNNNKSFSTYDHEGVHGCATDHHGGWWYDYCTNANLNGKYVTPGTVSKNNNNYDGVFYWDFQDGMSLKSTQMKMRILSA